MEHRLEHIKETITKLRARVNRLQKELAETKVALNLERRKNERYEADFVTSEDEEEQTLQKELTILDDSEFGYDPRETGKYCVWKNII